MAAIDKTYINNKKDYEDLKNWVSTQKSFTTPIGESFDIRDYMYNWDENAVLQAFENGKEVPIWNTPVVVDKYLYKNCPLKFVQDRLKDQYNVPEELLTKSEDYEYGKCKVLKFPKVFKDIDVEFEVINETDDHLVFNEPTNKWVGFEDVLSMSGQYTCGLSMRKLRRLLKTWSIPKGYAVYARMYYGNYTTKLMRVTSFAS